MGTKIFNFSTFSESKKTACPLLDKISSEQAKKHPEYGVLPFNSQCKQCVELIDRRSAYSRQFIDPQRRGHTYSQQSYLPLHYIDQSGLWRTIDPRLRPVQGQPGVYTAPAQPMPVRFDLASGYTSIDLHDLQLIYNKGLKMYFTEDTNEAPVNPVSADYGHYTVGDDGARVFNMWPGIDMEAFAKEGKIETNFIILSKQKMPVTKGYMVIEDHVALPEGYTLQAAGGLSGPARYDLLVKNKRGYVVACMQHVRLGNGANQGLATEYVVRKESGGYLIKMLVPYSFLDLDASTYPVVVDPVVSGSVDTGNFASTHLPSANLNFTTLPGHCDYHLIDTVPGMSQLLNAFVDIEDNTTGDVHCGDTVAADHGAFGHRCLKREIRHVLICDTCNAQILLGCFNRNNCDTAGLLTTDPVSVPGAGPIALGNNPFLSCLQPQCPDFYIAWTLENSDSSCEDNCGQLCAVGNKWRMLIEACQIDANITAAPVTVCFGQPVMAICHPDCGVPPYHYTWSNNATTDTIIFYPPLGGMLITCTAFDACNNPADANVITINVNPSPPASAGPDFTLCEGGTVTIGGSPTTSPNTNISWSASSAQALSWVSDTNAANPTVTVPAGTIDTTFYVLQTDSASCFRIDTMYIFSIPDPVAVIDTTGTTRICNGQSVVLNANGPFSAYLWNNGSTTQSITVSSPGAYYVVVTDSNGCKDQSNTLTVSTITVPSFHVFPDTLIFYGDSAQLYTDISLSPPAVDSFFWTPADTTINCLTCPNPFVAPLNAELYTLTIYTQGCVLSDSVLISVVLPNQFWIPDAFTPNGDGINDSFYLYGQSGVNVIKFQVFDRWGEKVHDGVYPWDGTYHGTNCLPGVYVYLFTVVLFGQPIGVERKGSVTLIK